MTKNNKEGTSAGGEALGAIIFTIVIGLLMWIASKWFL